MSEERVEEERGASSGETMDAAPAVEGGEGSKELPALLQARRVGGEGVCDLQGVRLKVLGEVPGASPRTFQVASCAEHSGGLAVSESTSLLWVGGGEEEAPTRALREALERLSRDSGLAGRLPRLLDHWDFEGEGTILLTEDDGRLDRAALSVSAWRGLELRRVVEILLDVAVTLDRLHRSGFALGGFTLQELLLDSEDRVALRGLGRMRQLSGQSSERVTSAVGADIGAFGVLLVEAATGRPFAELRHVADRMLHDVQVLVDSGLARPGLSQVVVGTLAGEYPFMYASMQELLAGLLQLRAELEQPMLYRAALCSTAGNFPLRRSDQDSCGVAEVRVVYHGVARHVGFYCVADGVGGEEHGERASQAAVNAALEAFHRIVARYDFETLQGSVTPLARALAKVASQHLAIRGEVDPEENKGATTFTGMLVVGDRAGIGHLGDSRAYLWRQGQIIRLTRDHNLANVKLALGELTEQDAAKSHDDQRRISRFMGTSNETPLSWVDGFDPRLLPNVVQVPAGEGRVGLGISPAVAGSPPSMLDEPEELTQAEAASLSGDTVDLPERSGSAAHLEETHDAVSSFEGPERTTPRRYIFDERWEEEARLASLTLQDGDRLMVMSDGLYGELSDDLMSEILATTPDVYAAARKLVDSALVGMSMDNVSVVVLAASLGVPNLRLE